MNREDVKREDGRYAGFTFHVSRFTSSSLLTFHFMQRMAAQSGGIFLHFHLLRTPSHLDFRAIVEIAGLGALQPDHFSAFFSHGTPALLLNDFNNHARADGL